MSLGKKNNTSQEQNDAVVTSSVSRKRDVIVIGVLLLLILIVYGRSLTYGYVLYDEPLIIFQNPKVMAGFSLQGAWWAFTNPNAGLYQPLPTITYMLDCTIFGKWLAGFHIMTLSWHFACCTAFYFLMMRLLQNFPVAVAASIFFCIFPIQTTIVSPVVSRNEIMVTLFVILSIGMYCRYAQQAFILPAGSANNSSWLYAPVRQEELPRNTRVFRRCLPAIFSLLFVVIGLLCKQSIMVLPPILLLLDYWPLGRIELSLNQPVRTLGYMAALTLEKIPWFILSGVGAYFALFGKFEFQVFEMDRLTFSLKNIGIATINISRYLGHMVYPLRATGGYPVVAPDIGPVLGAIFLLVAVTAVAFATLWRRPWVVVGWGWFVLFLLPVSGIIRYAFESIAMRYLYTAGIGLFIAGAYCLYDWAQAGREGEKITANRTFSKNDKKYWLVLGIVTFIMAALCFWQGGFMRSTEAIARRGLAVTGGKNSLSYTMLGLLRTNEGNHGEAYGYFLAAYELEPDNPRWRLNYAIARMRFGEDEEALELIEPLLKERPDVGLLRALYAQGLLRLHRLDDALPHLEHALRVDPWEPALVRVLAELMSVDGGSQKAADIIANVLKASDGGMDADELLRRIEVESVSTNKEILNPISR